MNPAGSVSANIAKRAVSQTSAVLIVIVKLHRREPLGIRWQFDLVALGEVCCATTESKLQQPDSDCNDRNKHQLVAKAILIKCFSFGSKLCGFRYA